MGILPTSTWTLIYYQLHLESLSPLASLPVSGASVSAADIVQFVPWQPSQWAPPPTDDHEFVSVLKRIAVPQSKSHHPDLECAVMRYALQYFGDTHRDASPRSFKLSDR
jgi:hypothetical protein